MNQLMQLVPLAIIATAPACSGIAPDHANASDRVGPYTAPVRVLRPGSVVSRVPRGYTIDVLFDQYHGDIGVETQSPPTPRDAPRVEFGEDLFAPTVCRETDSGSVRLARRLTLKRNGAFLSEPGDESECAPVKVHAFGTGPFTPEEQGVPPTLLDLTNMKLRVQHLRNRCSDTGVNRLELLDGGQWVEFTNALNLIIFEADVDENQVPETYIASYQSCEGWLRILRVAPASAIGGPRDG